MENLEEDKQTLITKVNEMGYNLDEQFEDCKDLKMNNSIMLREIQQLRLKLQNKEGELKVQIELNRKILGRLQENNKKLQVATDEVNRKRDGEYAVASITGIDASSDLPPDIANEKKQSKNIGNKEFVENVNDAFLQLHTQLKKLQG